MIKKARCHNSTYPQAGDLCFVVQEINQFEV
jgi:hypothetical protein